MIFLLATVWNSLIAWLVIGVFYLLGGFIGGYWTFEPVLLWFWPAVLLIGYIQLAKDE